MRLTDWLKTIRQGLQPGSARRRRASTIRQAVEVLEDRTLLSVTPLFAGGQLNVSSDAGDAITINTGTSSEVLVNGQAVSGPGANGIVDADEVQEILVTGGPLQNDIDLAGVNTAEFTNLSDGKVTLFGGNSEDTIVGSEFADTIDANDNNDVIDGGLGEDTIDGDDGDDTIDGNAGDDSLLGENGDDVITGGAGNDTLDGEDGEDSLDAGDGNDNLIGGNGADSLTGGAGMDSLLGGEGIDQLFGGDDIDLLNGQAGNDFLVGGAGDDTAFGGAGQDELVGGDGDDKLNGQSGRDTIDGGAGNDTLLGSRSSDSLTGGDGNDLLNGNLQGDSLAGGAGDDSLFGGAGQDELDGGADDDVVRGQGGNDTLFISEGADRLEGGLGNDVMERRVAPPDVDGDEQVVFLDFDTETDQGEFTYSQTERDMIQARLEADYAEFNVEFTQSQPTSGAFSTLFFNKDPRFDLLSVNVTSPDSQFRSPTGASIDVTTAGTFTFPSTSDWTDIPSFQWDLVSDDAVTSIDDVTFRTDAGMATVDFTSGTITANNGGNVFEYIEDNMAARSIGMGGPSNHFHLSSDASIFSFDSNGVEFSLLRPDTPVDFRNLAENETASVDINPLLGGSGQPAGTSQNLVAVSANVAARELGHLLGLREGDSFGPIGSGISNPPGSNAFNPAYPGTENATETLNHLMADVDVGQTTNDLTGDLFFSERSAIKLAFAAADPSVPEQTTAHDTMATAQQIELNELNVPNPLVSGTNAGETFRVTAAGVVGSLSTSGESDFYSFSADAGELINIELMSESLARISDSVDSIINVFDSSGNLVPYFGNTATNDDDFQTNDSIIIDLTLPSDDTYFVEVAASPSNASDTGDYELLLSSFATGPAPAMDDTLLGGSGDDTIIAANGNDLISGNSGDDSIDGGAGQDSIFGGTGDDTIDGGDGGDKLKGQMGVDSITGGNGNDTILWNTGDENETVLGGNGFDRIEAVFSSIDNSSPPNNPIDIFVKSFPATDRLALAGEGQEVVAEGLEELDVDSGKGDDRINVADLSDFPALRKLILKGDGGKDVIDASALQPVDPFGLLQVTLQGGDGDDTLLGGETDDVLEGGFGNDSLLGSRGDDTLRGGAAGITSGDGLDILEGQRGNDLLLGGDQIDQLRGGRGNDTGQGGDGNDVIDGGAGNDSLQGEAGDDAVSGDDGRDTLEGGIGQDTLRGDNGEDSLAGGTGNDELRGGDQDDTLTGGIGDDLLIGGDGTVLVGQTDDDSLTGGFGQDTLNGKDGADTLMGEADDDKLFGGSGDDLLDGGVDDDTLRAHAGDDSLIGADGDDLLDGDAGNDTLHGEDGNDRLIGGDGSDGLCGGDGADTVNGQAADDTLLGDDGPDAVRGGAGDDTLLGGNGNDTLDGQGGSDILDRGQGNDLPGSDNPPDETFDEPFDKTVIGSWIDDC